MTAPVLDVVDLTAGYVARCRSCASSRSRSAPGSITTLIGGNGAGKSTLLRAIYGGTCRWFSGRITFKGEPIERLKPWERVRRGIGLVPQGRCNFAAMSVAENLRIGCYSLPASRHRAAIDRVVERFPLLRQKWSLRAGNLSGGEQQVLETAMVLLTDPALLLLDEPSLGLAPKMQGEVFAAVRRVAATGVAVLVVEQNVHGALLISDTAIVIEQGRKFLEGPAREVRNDPRIREAYLGGNVKAATAP